MVNTLICTVTSRHFAVISAFFSSMMSSLAGKNLVIGTTTGEGRFRSPSNSSPLMEEGLEESAVSVSRKSWKEKEKSGLRIGVELTGMSTMSSL